MRHSSLLIVVFVLLFSLYVFRGTAILDPDFGWHIQAGQYILTKGFPYTDPFSYTMPSYLFVDHEWLTNLLWAIALPITGYMSLVIIYALFAVAAVFLQITLTTKKWLLLPVILAGGSLLDFVGVRTQVIDWLFTSILIFVLWKKEIWERWWFFLPLLFLLWANIHGGFGIGLGVLAVILTMKSIEERKNMKRNIFLLSVCILITLINPFGIRLWGEFLNQLSDTQLRFTIDEWFPAYYFTNIAFWMYTVMSVWLVIRYRKRFSYTVMVIYGLLFIAGMTSMRNIPLFIIISIYPTIKGIEYLYEEASKYAYGKERFVKGYKVFIALSLIFFLPQLGMFIYGVGVTPNNKASYPVGAVAFLTKHMPTENIMTTYGWSGYLLWQLPEKKDFIDGRMPSWRNPDAPENESTYALSEYQAILKQREPFITAADKYRINTLLVPTSELHDQPLRLFGIDVETNPVLNFLFGSTTTFSKVVSQVRHLGWQEVYHDKVAVVFEKK